MRKEVKAKTRQQVQTKMRKEVKAKTRQQMQTKTRQEVKAKTRHWLNEAKNEAERGSSRLLMIPLYMYWAICILGGNGLLSTLLMYLFDLGHSTIVFPFYMY